MKGWHIKDNDLRFKAKDFDWYIAPLRGKGVCGIVGDDNDSQLHERIVAVLNRELPNGKFRSRKKSK